ncbi:MAG: metallophosphoesterase [Armatimonadetes bacterium]|nr:metallophosphoesterase [Armatimonadota bacterium]
MTWQLFEGTSDQPSKSISGVPDGTRFVFVSDSQVPLEDSALLETIFKQFVPWFKPKSAEYHLFLGGDIIDNFTLSSFLQRVVPKFTLGDEVDMVHAYIKAWGKKFTHRHYIFGNHEDRWEREMYARHPQMMRFSDTLEEALELETLGYDWVPYLKHYDFEGLVLTHGDITTIQTAAAMMKNYQSSGVSGHTNRPQCYTWSAAAGGEPRTWYVAGMTCRRDIGDVIKDWRRVQPWQQGFVIGEVRRGVVFVEEVRVHHGQFRAAGKMFDV